MNEVSNSQQNSELPDDSEMLDEYDFSQGVRGKYYQRYRSNDQKTLVKIRAKDGDRNVTMKTIETKALVTSDGKLIVQVPSDITPGEHRVVLIIEENTTLPTAETLSEIDNAENDPG